jgi:hypothetical protein
MLTCQYEKFANMTTTAWFMSMDGSIHGGKKKQLLNRDEKERLLPISMIKAGTVN